MYQHAGVSFAVLCEMKYSVFESEGPSGWRTKLRLEGPSNEVRRGVLKPQISNEIRDIDMDFMRLYIFS